MVWRFFGAFHPAIGFRILTSGGWLSTVTRMVDRSALWSCRTDQQLHCIQPVQLGGIPGCQFSLNDGLLGILAYLVPERWVRPLADLDAVKSQVCSAGCAADRHLTAHPGKHSRRADLSSLPGGQLYRQDIVHVRRRLQAGSFRPQRRFRWHRYIRRVAPPDPAEKRW